MENNFKALFDFVQTRPRPEDVAESILSILELSPKEKSVLEKAAKYSMKKLAWSYSSMANDFFRPSTGVSKQAELAFNLLDADVLPPDNFLDSEKVELFLDNISSKIGKFVGCNDFKNDRLSKTDRRKMGIYKNARWYNKRWRLIARIENKIRDYIRNDKKYLFTRVSKSSIATLIPFDEFSKDLNTACFIAYMTARMSLRSMFTNTSQDRPYDEIADILMKRCKSSDTTNWFAIAHVMTDQYVIDHLSDEDKGALLSKWYNLLSEISEMLEDIWNKSKFNFKSMIVKRGDDSTTWNQIAGAWNKARENWINLLYSLELDNILFESCPGKVMRLMAADVAYWHKSSGGDLHPDTMVWAELPKPWEVLNYDVKCNRETIERLCKQYKAEVKTWILPKSNRKIENFRLTPELVHGVSVGCPQLALILRKCGVFSGKKIKGELPEFDVVRDEHGAALEVV